MKWEEFRVRIRPLATLRPPSSNLECLLTPKSNGWGVQDVNWFAGRNSSNRSTEINELDEFDNEEGEFFFDANFKLAKRLIEDDYCKSVQVNIGFNPNDFSEGHHSIKKLHSHIRITPSAWDLKRRESCPWRKFDRFDRFAFIEPFSPIYHDYVLKAVREGWLEAMRDRSPPIRCLGYTSLKLSSEAAAGRIFPDLKNLYAVQKEEYSVIQDIFTDGQVDNNTSRYMPRPAPERLNRVNAFLSSKGGFLSKESKNALLYLAKNIRPATPRIAGNDRDMSSADKAYITRGFAGAFTFTLSRSQKYVRLDLLPRIITTSSVIKTLMGTALPTIVANLSSPATDLERETTARYHEKLVSVLEEEFSAALVEQPKTTQIAQ